MRSLPDSRIWKSHYVEKRKGEEAKCCSYGTQNAIPGDGLQRICDSKDVLQIGQKLQVLRCDGNFADIVSCENQQMQGHPHAHFNFQDWHFYETYTDVRRES